MKLIFDWGGIFTKGREGRNFIDNIKDETGVKTSLDFIGPLLYDMNSDLISFQDFYKKIKEKYGLQLGEEKLRELFLNSIIPDHDMMDFAKRLDDELYILSNNNRIHLKYIKENFGDFLSGFKGTYFSCEIKLRKPHEEIFRYLLDDLDAKASEFVFIDDKEENIEVAGKLGFRTILFRNKEQLERELREMKKEI
ncbi:MAG: HAD family hydrolase [Nanobdellota archaeon]